ncbi:Protein fam76b, variant 2 [Schistosoma haematobium]|uniref:Protein fam76b, variant 2 n=1 Tax=Schistosoma haematobium TaxID=6185 RepID=A0A922IKT4_SCHHA|nr:Protein fam76b, variant 2 [Schistosoma haematobium]KAH9581629.1 Protein fam76b, variant 2 [Schistosoma haematobium]
MLVRPGLSELRMLDNSLCSIITVSEGLLTSSGNTMLVMQRFGIVCSGADNPIGVTILKRRLLWLGHVLRLSSQRIPRRALFADAGTGWKKRRGGQCMTWCRSMKESCKGLSCVGPSRLPGWGPRDGATQWLETLSDMAQNRSQWRSCCNLLLLSS